jgi:hypothetical protein
MNNHPYKSERTGLHSVTWRLITTEIVLFVIFFLLLFDDEAYAYLDPGTAGFLVQFALGVVAGAVIVIRNYFGVISKCFAAIYRKYLKEKLTHQRWSNRSLPPTTSRKVGVPGSILEADEKRNCYKHQSIKGE